MKISASILAGKLTALSETVPGFEKSAIDLIHMDIMDGNYVPQISFGEAFTSEISKLSDIPLDVHLMVKNPELEVPKYYQFKPYCITFHVETTNFGIRLANEIKSQGIKAGISLNPGTPVESLVPLIPYVDLILVMTVEPGFYGQSFVKNGINKIENVRKLIQGFDVELEVDGGVNPDNIKELQKAGVGICVVGSALFKGGNPNESARRLKALTS
ncbi:MAG: ribulose-phosphate 3-epimerase [Leptospira sp.]|nr:ribulose-phosphate 3-epimerase [Leptospira sp.]